MKEDRNELESNAYANRNLVNMGGQLFDYVKKEEAEEIKKKI